jgi:hypothetical protein
MPFCVKGRVRVTPQDVPNIIECWSGSLGGTYPIQEPPRIDHAHIFQIMHICPQLQHSSLGLPFDATSVSDVERSPYGPFPELLELRVCSSLMNSTPRLVSFMQGNLPGLRTLAVQFPWTYMPESADQKAWDTLAETIGTKQRWSYMGAKY